MRLMLPGSKAILHGRFRHALYWFGVGVIGAFASALLLNHPVSGQLLLAGGLGFSLLLLWGMFWTGLYEYHVESLKRVQGVLLRNASPENRQVWLSVLAVVKEYYGERIQDEVPLLFADGLHWMPLGGSVKS